MPGQHKNKSQLKFKLFNNRKESMTVRAELMDRQERERQFQLPSIQVTWKSLNRSRLFEIPQERVRISTHQAKWRKGDFNTELEYSVPVWSKLKIKFNW